MTDIREEIIRLVKDSTKAIGEVQEATERTFRVKLNVENTRKMGFRPSIGDFLILEGDNEYPVGVVYSIETKSNIPITELIEATREQRTKIYYEPPAVILSALISGYFDESEGVFYQELPNESILPDDLAFYMSDLENAVFNLHCIGALKIDYLPYLQELVDDRDVIRVWLRKLSRVLSKKGVSKEEFLSAAFKAYKRSGRIERKLPQILDLTQLIDEVWKS